MSSTTFLEPGGDSTFIADTVNAGGFWSSKNSSPSVATDFVHGAHIKSLGYRPNQGDSLGKINTLADAGSRFSVYIYLNALPNATATLIALQTSGFANVVRVRLTSAGVLQLWDASAQIGTNGATLSTGTWYRISLAYTISSTTVNRFELFKDGVSTISITNATIGGTGTNIFFIGNFSANATLDLRASDIYIDDSSSLTDMGDIWVTAKRPNANGTTNNFNTQIGSGGSGYGSGHSPQVNERPLDTTNGWSVIGAGSAVTEEYNIEGKSVGDIDISTATIIDYMGWVSTKSLIAETGQIIVNNVTSNISITTSAKTFLAIAGSATYPAGTGTDIGIISSTTVTTVSLYECGIVVAYIPAAGGTNSQINIGDSWKSVAGMQINIGDTWKTVVSVKQNIGDTWKVVF